MKNVVYRDCSRWPCLYGASLLEEGCWWCRIHAPSKVAERRERTEARIEAQIKAKVKAKRELERRHLAFPLLVAALQNLISLSSPFFTDEVQMLALSKARIALVVAKGGTDA